MQDEGRRRIPLDCFNPTRSTAANRFRPIRRFPISCHSCDPPRLYFASRAECFGIFYVECVQTKPPENMYLQPTVFRDGAGACSTSERPEGSCNLTSLIDSLKENKPKKPLSGLKRHWKREISSPKHNMDLNWQLLAIRGAKNLCKFTLTNQEFCSLTTSSILHPESNDNSTTIPTLLIRNHY